MNHFDIDDAIDFYARRQITGRAPQQLQLNQFLFLRPRHNYPTNAAMAFEIQNFTMILLHKKLIITVLFCKSTGTTH